MLVCYACLWSVENSMAAERKTRVVYACAKMKTRTDVFSGAMSELLLCVALGGIEESYTIGRLRAFLI